MKEICNTGLNKEIVAELSGSQLKVFACICYDVDPAESGLSMPTFKAAYEFLYAKGYFSANWKKYNLLVKLQREDEEN